MKMRKSIPLLLVTLLLVQSLMSITLENAEAAIGRGGSDDDYSISEISVNSDSAKTWIQPDGTSILYVGKGDIVEITVEVKRGGSDFQVSNATVTVEMVHPIGFVLNKTTWTTTPLVGSQSYTESFEWEAFVAHSHLNVTTNELSGGIIIRATVQNPADDRNENDVMEMPLPVALSSDKMDAEGDVRDGYLPAKGIQTFFGGEYPNQSPYDATGRGIWQEDNSASAVGDANWRHRNLGSDYPSNTRSRLVYAYRSTTNNYCGTSLLDGGLSNAYGDTMCKLQLNSAALLSAQMHVQTWGQMGAGDLVALELWRGNGAPEMTLSHNFANDLPSTGQGQWSNISWDPTEQLGGHSWSYGIIFQSDTTGAAAGMHVDDFVLFGIEKVDEFTIDVDCDNPSGGYTSPPNNILSMYCVVTNNGYRPAQIKIESSVSNDSWMNPFPLIRIDSANPTQHGVQVVIPPIPAGNTTEMWINLSIPAGSDVQQQVWEVWWEDFGGTQLGELGRVTADLAITEQYGVQLSSTAPLVAGSLLPGESMSVPFKLQNAGNREAQFSINSNFQGDDWVSYVTDQNNSIVQMPIPLSKGESTELLLNITSPNKAVPGEVPFSVRAVCPSCGGSLFGADVISKKIEIPQLTVFEMVAEEMEIMAPANGNSKVVYIDLTNLGNYDESYTLELTQSNWKLQGYLSTDETPVLDAWDGSTTLALNLPMPIGLAPGLYTAKITATSKVDPTVSEDLTINVDVEDTSAVSVSDEDAGQSYLPGGDAQSMRFMVTNDGNQEDRFTMSLNLPEGMSAQFEQLADGNLTPNLAPGESYNLTVRFSFDKGVNGQLTMLVVATSVNDPTVSSNGKCTYRVGSQNWLRIISTESTIIDEAGVYEVKVTVKNQYNEGQSVSMDWEQGDTRNWFRASIKSTDRDFWLEVGGNREVAVVFEVQSSSLENLEEEFIESSVTIWAISNSVEDAASLELPVTLKRTSDDSESSSSGSDSIDWIGIGIWVVGGAIIVALLGTLLVILNSEEEETQDWSEGGYEDNLTATYGAVAAAPNIGSMEKSVPVISPPPGPALAPIVVQTGPPVPAEGLPEGWTMEQWNHYGQQWLDNNR